MRELLERAVGPIILLSVVGLTGWSIWSSQKSRARQGIGLCARCGRMPGTRGLSDGLERVTMCEACAVKTTRHHVAAYYFFLGAGVLTLALVTFGLTMDVRRGHALSTDTLGLAVPVILPFLIAWQIRKRIGGPRS